MELIKVIAVRPVPNMEREWTDFSASSCLSLWHSMQELESYIFASSAMVFAFPDLAAMVSFHPIPAFSANEGDTNATARTAAASAPCITAFIMNHLVL
jgi:hypothetical protein